MPAEKELEFFSYRNQLANVGFNKYLAHFQEAGNTLAIGEATARYFWTRTNSHWGELPTGFQTNIPATVHGYLGEELKLLVTLRNPVKRAISAYLHYLAMGEIAADTDFMQALSYSGVVDMGFYAQHLCNWLAYYPLEQIKVLTLEQDIQARPVETLAAVCDFLSIPGYNFSAESVRPAVFAGTQRVINSEGVFVAGDRPVAHREDGWFKDAGGQFWHKIISTDKLRQLHNIFLADVKKLDEMLGTNLLQYWGMNT